MSANIRHEPAPDKYSLEGVLQNQRRLPEFEGVHIEGEKLDSGILLFTYTLEKTETVGVSPISQNNPELIFLPGIRNFSTGELYRQVRPLLEAGVPRIVSLHYPYDKRLHIEEIKTILDELTTDTYCSLIGVCLGADFITRWLAEKGSIPPEGIQKVLLCSPVLIGRELKNNILNHIKQMAGLLDRARAPEVARRLAEKALGDEVTPQNLENLVTLAAIARTALQLQRPIVFEKPIPQVDVLWVAQDAEYIDEQVESELIQFLRGMAQIFRANVSFPGEHGNLKGKHAADYFQAMLSWYYSGANG